jgi:soluble lytic murein transglycosylase-like protein
VSLTLTGATQALSRIEQLRSLVAPPGFDRLITEASRGQEEEAPVAVDQRHMNPARREELPAGAQRWMGSIRAAAQRHDLDPDLLTALVWTESSFVPDAVSHAGAIGLAQLMPATADALGVDPFDPAQNLEGGAKYLRQMIDRFGRVDLALAAYNAGPTRLSNLLDANGAVPISRDYVSTVLDRHQALGAQT